MVRIRFALQIEEPFGANTSGPTYGDRSRHQSKASVESILRTKPDVNVIVA